MSTTRFLSPASAAAPTFRFAAAATPNLRDNNPFTEQTGYPLPIELCPFAAGMSEEEFQHTFRTRGNISLNAFGSQPIGGGRFLYIASLTIDGTMCCTTTEAAGPIQALCQMLDTYDIHLDIKTIRQREMPQHPHQRFATFLEIENRYFTHWTIGYGHTSEEASLAALIVAANQYRQFQDARRTGTSTGIAYTGSLDSSKDAYLAQRIAA